MNALKINNLIKYYDAQKAVDNISFSVSQGSIFGLLGPNGAGKTTLIRMITGILFPDNGTITLHDKPFDPENDLAMLGYMPEERGLYKKMRAGEQAVYLAQLKGLSRSQAVEAAKHWFKKLDMQSWWNRKVADLSKGMGQKLQFVVTVMHNPSLIILDEPFSGLDPVNSNLIKEEIFALSKEGKSIIFSTHRMEQVEEICDHIVLVNQGRKILDGTVADIRQQYKENLFVLHLDEVPDEAPHDAFKIISKAPGKLIIKMNDGYRPNDALLHYLSKNITITGFYEILPSMNDIFIRLVKARQIQNGQII